MYYLSGAGLFAGIVFLLYMTKEVYPMSDYERKAKAKPAQWGGGPSGFGQLEMFGGGGGYDE